MNHSPELSRLQCPLVQLDKGQDGRDPREIKKAQIGLFWGFCFQIYRGAKMHFHTAAFFFFSFIACVKENTLFFKRGNPPLKLWNTDTASFILAKVDWADDVDPLNLDSIKGFAIFISQARCSSSSVGINSRRGVRVCWSKRKSDPGTKKSHEENGYYLHWSPNSGIT